MMKSGLTVLGIIFLLAGAVWTGQGLGIIRGSFMTGQNLWLLIGLLCLVAGVGLLLGGLRAQRKS